MCIETKPEKYIQKPPEMEVRKFGTRHSVAEVLVPSKPMPHEIKLLSDIDDQEAMRFNFPLIMFFTNNNNDNEASSSYSSPSLEEGRDPAKVIKEGIREALVHYYPLAGRLREGDNRKLMVDCNGEGVLFVEAYANVSLEELGDSILPPCPYLNHFLIPLPGSQDIIGCPLLFVQVYMNISLHQINLPNK